MEKVRKNIEEILNKLERIQEEMEIVYSETATFYTSLKGKDINQAYLHMISLGSIFEKTLKDFDSTVDYYDSKVSSMLEEEENERKK